MRTPDCCAARTRASISLDARPVVAPGDLEVRDVHVHAAAPADVDHLVERGEDVVRLRAHVHDEDAVLARHLVHSATSSSVSA